MLEAARVDALVRRLQHAGNVVPVPLLVLRVRDLERTAWRRGRHVARALERKTLRSFVNTARRTLRASDLLAHDDESEDFLAALVSPTRNARSVTTATDCRAALARLASAVESCGEITVETGWTLLRGVETDPRLRNAVETALERGARERERYAFFSTIGHELRTPLCSLRGYLETLLEQTLDPPTARRFLGVALAEAMRLNRLVESMFEVSLLDLQEGSRRGESSLLAGPLAAALDAVAPQASARETTVVRAQFPEVEVALGADRLTQAMVIILDNAIKHGRAGGRVIVSAAPLDERYLEVRIDDDGGGVAPTDREAIFALARRGANVQAQGSGIGLAVARLMLERIGGEVDVVDSALGGAQFRLRLPLLAPFPEGLRVANPRLHS